MNLFLLTIETIKKLDPQVFAPLKNHQGKRGILHVTDLNYSIAFTVTDNTIKIRKTPNNLASHHLTISGKSVNLLALFLSKQTSPVSLFSKNNITVLGDTGLLMALNQVVQQLDIDWEDHLAKWVGDFAAFHMGQHLRSRLQWMKNIGTNRCQDLTLFLQEEKKLLPTAHELKSFYDNVDALHARVEKLALRLDAIV